MEPLHPRGRRSVLHVSLRGFYTPGNCVALPFVKLKSFMQHGFYPCPYLIFYSKPRFPHIELAQRRIPGEESCHFLEANCEPVYAEPKPFLLEIMEQRFLKPSFFRRGIPAPLEARGRRGPLPPQDARAHTHLCPRSGVSSESSCECSGDCEGSA